MAFSSTRIFKVSPEMIYPLADDLEGQLAAEGYQVSREDCVTGGIVVSLTKGGMFKAVLGMNTALKIQIAPEDDKIKVDTSVGIFGQQAIPTAISMLIFWPILITQLWGLIKQSNLDGHVYELVQQSIIEHAAGASLSAASEKGMFCPNCGAKVTGGKFCAQCGAKL